MKNGFDAVTTWVDILSGRVHFIKTKNTDTAVDVANSFFENIFKYQILLKVPYHILIPSSIPSSKVDLWN